MISKTKKLFILFTLALFVSSNYTVFDRPHGFLALGTIDFDVSKKK